MPYTGNLICIITQCKRAPRSYCNELDKEVSCSEELTKLQKCFIKRHGSSPWTPTDDQDLTQNFAGNNHQLIVPCVVPLKRIYGKQSSKYEFPVQYGRCLKGTENNVT